MCSLNHPKKQAGEEKSYMSRQEKKVHDKAE